LLVVSSCVSGSDSSDATSAACLLGGSCERPLPGIC
jgi:hypothetical protein